MKMSINTTIVVVIASFLFSSLYQVNALCGGMFNSQFYCVMGKSAYWKTESLILNNRGTSAHYYVCRFTDDAKRNCNAQWTDCLHIYVNARYWFDKLTFGDEQRAVDAGKAGYETGNCDPFK